jgi:hypothetical protein
LCRNGQGKNVIKGAMMTYRQRSALVVFSIAWFGCCLGANAWGASEPFIEISLCNEGNTGVDYILAVQDGGLSGTATFWGKYLERNQCETLYKKRDYLYATSPGMWLGFFYEDSTGRTGAASKMPYQRIFRWRGGDVLQEAVTKTCINNDLTAVALQRGACPKGYTLLPLLFYIRPMNTMNENGILSINIVPDVKVPVIGSKSRRQQTIERFLRRR